VTPALPPRYCRVCHYIGHRPKSPASGGELLAWVLALVLVPFGFGVLVIIGLIVYGSHRAGHMDQCPRCKNRGTLPYTPALQQQLAQQQPWYPPPQ
jgi:hypothetical protein